MTRFLDGPAVDVVLALRRAPVFLRAVRDRESARVRDWDACDQLEDRPSPNETVVVYRRVSAPFRAHINRGRRHGGCMWVEAADYRVIDPQPDDATLRDNNAFRAWAWAQTGALTAQSSGSTLASETQPAGSGGGSEGTGQPGASHGMPAPSQPS